MKRLGIVSTLHGFLILWTLLLALWIYIYSIRDGGVTNWDGFERLGWAAQIWYDFRHGDGFHLWRHTNSQVIWPFLHSWITGFLFVILGPSMAVARLLSLLAFLGVSLGIVYRFSRRKTPYALVGGTVAWGLLTTSPLMVENTATIMSEWFGLFLVFFILIFIPPPARSGDDREAVSSEPSGKSAILYFYGRWFSAAILLSLLFFYKYNFALLTYIGLLLARFAQERYSLRRMISWRNTILFGVPLCAVIGWFFPYFAFKWQHFMGFITNNPEARMPFGWDYLWFYFRTIPTSYYSLPFFWPVSLGIVGWVAFHDRRMGLSHPFMACFLVHFLAAVAHPMKMERFQMIPLGLFFVLTGESVEWIFARVCNRFQGYTPSRILEIAGGLSGLILIPAVLYQSDFYRTPQIHQGSTVIVPLQDVLDQVEEGDRIALLVTHDMICTPSVIYYYIADQDRLMCDLRTKENRWRHIFLYQSKEELETLSYEERVRLLRETLQADRSNKLVIIECLEPERIGYFEKVYGGTEEIVTLVEELPDFTLLYEKEYPISFTYVRIYSIKDPSLSKESLRTDEQSKP